MNLKCIKYLTIISILILSCKLEPRNEEPPPGDTTPPHIVVVFPANDAIGVSVTISVSVTFFEPMDKTSAQGAFSLADGVTPVAGTFSWSDDTMTFDPSCDLSCSNKYYVKVTTSAKDTSGNSMASEFNSSFTTAAGPDTTPPSITAVSPVDLATDVPITANISITFSEQMEAASAQNAFTLLAGVTAVGGTFGWSGNTMTFDPSSNLSYSITYSVKVTTSAKDTAGNSMASEFNSSFTTAAVPDTTPPTVITPIVLNSGGTYTRNVDVSISHSVSEAAQMIISENSAFSGSSWVVYEASPAYTLSSTDGTKTVYIKYRDTADNETATYSDSIILDHNVYVSPSGSDSNAGTPDSPRLTLAAGVTLAAASAPVQMRVEGSAPGIIYDLGSAGLVIPAGVSLMGGYNATFSARDSTLYVSKITSTNTYTILFDGASVANNTVLDGFTITNTAIYQENVYTLFCRNSAAPQISNNKIYNEATNIISSISDSAATACVFCDSSSPLLERNMIKAGSGIHNLNNCVGSAGVFCKYGSPVIQSNVSIDGGSGISKGSGAGSAGIFCFYSTARILNNISIIGGSGSATYGAGSAGIYCLLSQATISGNKAIEGGNGSVNERAGSVGIYYDGCSPLIDNNEIIFGGSGTASGQHSAGSAGIAGRGTPTISHNKKIDGGSGTSNGPNFCAGSSAVYCIHEAPTIMNNLWIYGGSGKSIGYDSAGSAGIFCNNNSVNIYDNLLIGGGNGTASGNYSSGSAGVFCFHSTTYTIYIHDNGEINSGNGSATGSSSAGGSGVYCTNTANVEIHNNLIIGDSANATSSAVIDTASLWLNSGSSGKIANNTILAKTSYDYAIGIYLGNIGDVRIANNIILSINGTNRIGIFEKYSSYDPSVVINNLIFDCPSGLYFDEGTTAITAIDDVNALAECSHNITTTQTLSAMFVGGSPFDYHLASDSDAIDAGYNTSSSYWGGVTVDIDGETRPKGSAYDIGFDEY